MLARGATECIVEGEKAGVLLPAGYAPETALGHLSMREIKFHPLGAEDFGPDRCLKGGINREFQIPICVLDISLLSFFVSTQAIKYLQDPGKYR